MDRDVWMRFRRNATSITSTLVTGLWLGLLVSGVGGNLWLAVLIVGYVAVIPAVSMLFDDEEWEEYPDEDTDHSREREPDRSPAEDSLEKLRDRYAAGELTDDQFERKLDRLLETETLEDTERWRNEARDERNRRDESTSRDRSRPRAGDRNEEPERN